MPRLLAFSFALLVATSGATLAAPCTQVVLKPDQSSIILQGKTTGSDTDFTCFQLTTDAGRRLHLSLIRPADPGLAFTIVDVVDNQNDYSFVTGGNSYKILTYGTFRGTAALPFRISVTALSSGNATDLGDPPGTVSAVVKLDDQRSSLFSFNDQPTPLMRKYFTADFITVWIAAMRHNKDQPVLDGDPLTGLQGVKSLVFKSHRTDLINSDPAAVTAQVVAQPDGSTFTRPNEMNLRFDMKREDGSWKIKDVSSPSQPSLRAYLSRFK